MNVWDVPVVKAHLRCLKSAVSLQSCISVAFNAPPGLRAPAGIPDSCFWEAVWTQCTGSVKVIYRVTFDHPSLVDGNESVVSRLKDDLQQWKLWSELGFVACLIDTHLQTRSDGFQIVLQLSRRHDESNEPVAGNLGDTNATVGRLASDILSVLTIKELKFELRLQADELSSKRLKLTKRERAQPFHSLIDDFDVGVPTVASIRAYDAQSALSELSSLDFFGTIQSDGCASSTQSSWEEAYLQSREEKEEMLLDNDTSGTEVPRYYTHHTSVEPDTLSPAVKYRAIANLVDAAVRRAIVSKPVHISRDVQYNHESGLSRLVNIAPCMFCPGHLQATAARAPHVSSIAASLSGILRRTQHRCPERTVGRSHGAAMQLSQASLQSKIWLAMRKKFIKHGPAQRLSPLRGGPPTDAEQGIEDDDILMPDTPPCRAETELSASDVEFLDDVLSLDYLSDERYDDVQVCTDAEIDVDVWSGDSCVIEMLEDQGRQYIRATDHVSADIFAEDILDV